MWARSWKAPISNYTTSTMPANFFPSQLGSPEYDPACLSYTISPFQLLLADLVLCIKQLRNFPSIFLPIQVESNTPARQLDEFKPSWENFKSLSVQVVLGVCQLIFLFSIPVLCFCVIPPYWLLLYIYAYLYFNDFLFRSINGSQRYFESRAGIEIRPEHRNEKWIFINGVATGRHWFQLNLDRLSWTFGRKITGVHNHTIGIVFDILQCLIQRDFGYSTNEIRDAYSYVKSNLIEPKHQKVILIVHSQGGIIASLMLDWLLAELPRDALQKLEIYTFASAANHLNNPSCVMRAQHDGTQEAGSDSCTKAIRYIEHYANNNDFVSQWGVLNFASVENRFMGRLFERIGRGHLFNQHILHFIFPLDSDMKVKDVCPFMEQEMEHKHDLKPREDMSMSIACSSGCRPVFDVNEPICLNGEQRSIKVKDLSRLWLYRNGGSPPA